MLIGKDKIEQFLNDEGINDYIESPKNGIKKKFAINSPFCSDTEKNALFGLIQENSDVIKAEKKDLFFSLLNL